MKDNILMHRSTSRRALPRRALSVALTLTAALIVTLAAQVGGALSPSAGLVSYAYGAPDGCQGLLQRSAEAWLRHQTGERFDWMVKEGMNAGMLLMAENHKHTKRALSSGEQVLFMTQGVYASIAKRLQPVLSQSIAGTQCAPISVEQVERVLRTPYEQGSIKERAGALGLGTAGAVGAGLTAAAIGGYAALNAGFWATAWAGGSLAVATGALVPEPTTLAIIGVGGTVVAGGWYWWKKSEYEESVRAYVSAVQSHVKNQVSLGAVARGLTQ